MYLYTSLYMFTIIWNNNPTINYMDFIYKKKKINAYFKICLGSINVLVMISLFNSHYFVLFVKKNKIQNMIHMKFKWYLKFKTVYVIRVDHIIFTNFTYKLISRFCYFIYNIASVILGLVYYNNILKCFVTYKWPAIVLAPILFYKN
jgi:hypothetical protein